MSRPLGPSRATARDALGCALVVALVLAIPLIAGGHRAVLGSYQDDAYYYFRIARNVARGEGITFDGIHATSGVHPLWLAALVPIFEAWGGAMPPLIAAAVAQILLASAAAGLTTATLSRIVDRWSAVAAGLVLVAVPATGASLIGGLEGALALAAAAFAWRLWVGVLSRPAVAPSAWIGPGLAFALCGLARLEAFVFVPAALALGIPRMRGSGAAAAALAVPGAVAAAVVVVASRALTATWLPISGAVKAASVARRGGVLPATLAIGVALAVAAVGAAILAARRGVSGPIAPALLLPTVAGLLWIAADLITMGSLESWNRVPVLLLVMAAVVAVGARGYGGIAVALVAVAALCRVPLALSRGPIPASSYAPYRWEAGLWLRDHVDAEARIGSWNAGTIAYASDRRVVNLDGLVNDRAYFDEVIRGQALAEYLDRERISWLVDQSCGVDPTPEPYLVRTGSQAIARRTELVASFYDRNDRGGCPGVAVWRLNGPPADP
jgi:hypothetical protein